MLANRPIAVDFYFVTMYSTGGIFIFPFVFIILDIVTETYGPSISRSLILMGFLAEFLMSIVGIAVSHMGYPESFQESHATAYKIVFDSTFWYVISSCVAALAAEFVNNYYIFKWKLKYKGQWFLIRSVISTAIGQAVLTVLVILLAFSNKFHLHELITVMLHGYLWKMAFTSLMVIPSWMIVKHLKNIGVDSYKSSKANINPFGLNNAEKS